MGKKNEACDYANVPQSSIASSLLGRNVLSTLFSNICFSCNVRDQVSHAYKITGKITFLYILICMFSDSKVTTKKFRPKCIRYSAEFNLHLLAP